MNNLFFPPLFWFFLSLLVVWDLVWRGLSLWTAAKNQQKIWFIALLLVNSLGLLPLIYLVFGQKNKPSKKQDKTYLVYKIALGVSILLLGLLVLRFGFSGGEDTWVKEGNTYIKHGNPSAPKPKL